MSNEDTAPLKISIKRECSDQNGKEEYSIVPESLSLSESSQSPTQTTTFACGQYQYVKCAVPRCNNYFDGQRQEFIGISYFPFPEEPDLRNQWVQAIDLPRNTDTRPLKICSQHFGNNDIYNMQEVDGKTTAHLKPNAYPCKKLYAFVQNHDEQAHPYDESGKFIGFENPLMDTSRDVRTAQQGSCLLTTDKDALPKITSVLSMDANGKMVGSTGKVDSPGHSNAKPKVYTYYKKKTIQAAKQVADMASHADELIGEETVSSDDAGSPTPVSNPEKGLQVIPALVKLPPRLPKVDLVGDSINIEGNVSGGPITTSRLPNVDLSNEMDVTNEDESVTVANEDESVTDQMREEPSTSSIPVTLTAEDEHVPIKRRRGRRSKEEMRRHEEDDEWEPSFWGRRTLQKDGFASHLDADKKRKENETRSRITRSNDCAPDLPLTQSNEAEKNQDDGLEEEDEGWRVVEPIATGYRDNKSDEEAEDDSNNPLALLEVSMVDGETEGSKKVPSAVKRRPGPASKTCRPMYVPQTKDAEDNDVAEDHAEKKNGADDKESLSDDVYDSSLLVDWSFFKSLLPDLGKLSPEKRIELKSFVLDTLNSAIYDGKPITPILNL